jgi:hypothetical protein
MHVQMAFIARIRIRDNGREGAGEFRIVEHVLIRAHRHLDRLLDRPGLRPARSRPPVTRLAEYTGQESGQHSLRVATRGRGRATSPQRKTALRSPAPSYSMRSLASKAAAWRRRLARGRESRFYEA